MRYGVDRTLLSPPDCSRENPEYGYLRARYNYINLYRSLMNLAEVEGCADDREVEFLLGSYRHMEWVLNWSGGTVASKYMGQLHADYELFRKAERATAVYLDAAADERLRRRYQLRDGEQP